MNDNLDNNLCTHPGEKLHICEINDKEFSEKNNLNKQLWTQITNKNPHACEVCKKRFFLKYDFKEASLDTY